MMLRCRDETTQEDGRGTGCFLFFFLGGDEILPKILRYGDYMGIIYIYIYNIPTTWMSRGVGS